MVNIQKAPGSFIATMGYIGFVKYAPGTVGSLVTAIVAYIILLYNFHSFAILAILFLLSMTYGSYETFRYLKATKKSDPKEVIIDEFAGQSLTILIMLVHSKYNPFFEKISHGNQTISLAIICFTSFIFFRIFDISKPFPINYFDNMDNAFGVMMDDVVAGIMAALTIIMLLVIFFTW